MGGDLLGQPLVVVDEVRRRLLAAPLRAGRVVRRNRRSTRWGDPGVVRVEVLEGAGSFGTIVP